MTRYTITRHYHFESAHFLPNVPEGHRCKRMHGHNYEMDVVLTGELDKQGFVLDFWEIDALVQPLIDRVDHYVLNDVPGLENPTAELIASWFLHQLRSKLYEYHRGNPSLKSVVIWETKYCCAEAS